MTVRTLFASVAVLLCAARTALAATTDRDRDTNDGAAIVAGIVGVIVLLCWVCARVSDTRNSS